MNHFIQDVKRLIDSNSSRQEIVELVNEQLPLTNKLSCSILFIAGSKRLIFERNQVLAQLQQINNTFNTNYKTFNYEDSDRSFVTGGQQKEYNQFIKSKNDYIIFILTKDLGKITFKKFQIALNAYLLYGKPQIYVYHNPGNKIATLYKSTNVMEIIPLIKHQKQYYIPYKDLAKPGHWIPRDFSIIFH